MKKKALQININSPIMKGMDALYRLSFMEGFDGVSVGTYLRSGGANPIRALKRLFDSKDYRPDPSWVEPGVDFMKGIQGAIPPALRDYLEEELQKASAELINPEGTKSKPYYVGKTLTSNQKAAFQAGELKVKDVASSVGVFIRRLLINRQKNQGKSESLDGFDDQSSTYQHRIYTPRTDPRGNLSELLIQLGGDPDFLDALKEEIKSFPFEDASEWFGVSKKLIDAIVSYTSRVNMKAVNIKQEMLDNPAVALRTELVQELQGLDEDTVRGIASVGGNPEVRRKIYEACVEIILKNPEAVKGWGIAKKIADELKLNAVLVTRTLGAQNINIIRFLQEMMRTNPRIRKMVEDVEFHGMSYRVAKAYLKKMARR